MVELNHRQRTIKVKIVYYGPPVGGKTTNLQVLHQHAQSARRGEMISINSAQDRTILFDLLPMKAAGFRGFDLRLQILAVPGQAMYAATRRLVLKGADSLVFVANSAADRWEENIQSFREMTQNLIAHQLDPSSLPLVLQYNKRDLPEVTPIEFMDRALNARKVQAIPAVAVRGEGVLETFSAILLKTMQDLASRYQIIEASKGQGLPQWTQQTILGMFGTTALATEPNPIVLEPHAIPAVLPPSGPAPKLAESWPSERRTVRVALPEETVRQAGLGPDARANETLVESYAQASTQLSAAMGDLREERDLARRRLEDIHHALTAANEVLVGQPLDPVLRIVLGRMADAAGSSHAAFLRPEQDKKLRAVAFRGLAADPLLRATTGARPLLGKFMSEVEPRLHQAADSLDLGDALESSDPPFASVVVVPVRTARGLQGLAMLYFTPDAALPTPDALIHLGVLSRALSASLELATALETASTAERDRQSGIAGMAALRGLAQVSTALEDVRDRLGGMRRNPAAPRWLLDEFGRLAPPLSGAISTARSLLDFNKGEIHRESVSLEDLFSELRSDGVGVQVGPGTGAVSGDLVLLRLALKTLLEHAQGSAGPNQAAPALMVRSVADGGRVQIVVSGPAGPAKAPEANTAGLGLVRRIAELHGGGLSLEGDPAANRATLVLPAARTAATAQ